MRVCLVTVMVSPHQMPLARQIVARIGAENFRYIATEPVDAVRRELGWEDLDLPDWVLQLSANAKIQREIDEWIQNADVVLCGNRDIRLLQARAAGGKLTFYMSERWFKPWLGRGRLLSPAFLQMALRFRRVAESPWLHYLAIGKDAATDMHYLAAFPRRTWSWGYYVDGGNAPIWEDRRNDARMLWAGRMIKWKCVDLLIMAVHRLRGEGRNWRLMIVGSGTCEQALRKQVARLGLCEVVTFRPPVPIAEVRGLMRNADVYVLPSNGQEGWGAVVNEAMLEGCCLVASQGAGAAITMIRHGQNGLLFRSGSEKELCDCLRRVYDSNEDLARLARAGYETVSREWAPSVAAERWLAVCEGLLSGRTMAGYASGVMQRLDV